MNHNKRLLMVFLAALAVAVWGAAPDALAAGKNPCAMKNPCGMKNPCAMKKNPCGAKNPCGMKKKMIRDRHVTDYGQMARIGEKMWNDDTLGKSGMSCMSCHADHNYLNLDRHHGVWPHDVPKMTDDIMTLTQMINFCMLNPMEGEALDPHSVEMTAMAAFYTDYVKSWMKNPCAMKKHPCGMKNPCGAKKNPCGMKNPCGKR